MPILLFVDRTAWGGNNRTKKRRLCHMAQTPFLCLPLCHALAQRRRFCAPAQTMELRRLVAMGIMMKVQKRTIRMHTTALYLGVPLYSMPSSQ